MNERPTPERTMVQRHLDRMLNPRPGPQEARIKQLEEENALLIRELEGMMSRWKMVCSGCGSTDSLAGLHSVNPDSIACCPERNMQPTVYPVEPTLYMKGNPIEGYVQIDRADVSKVDLTAYPSGEAIALFTKPDLPEWREPKVKLRDRK